MKLRSSLMLACAVAAVSVPVLAAVDPITVNVDNFDRAQTDMEFDGIIKLSGGINKLHHNRAPTPIDKQNVIRMNRDTLYSLGVVDISKGATVTLPEAGKRYMSLMVINNDGYVNDLTAKPNADGSTTIRFGGCGDGVENCLPIMDGWNYAVRMYEPEQAIRDGSWTFPGPPVARSK